MPWYANIVNYLAIGEMPCNWSSQDKKKFLTEVKNFYWDDPYLFKYYSDQIFRRCIPEDEVSRVIQFCHSEACGGPFFQKRQLQKYYSVDFISLHYLKIHIFCKLCKNCQMTGSISKLNMMPLNPILVIEIFDC